MMLFAFLRALGELIRDLVRLAVELAMVPFRVIKVMQEHAREPRDG